MPGHQNLEVVGFRPCRGRCLLSFDNHTVVHALAEVRFHWHKYVVSSSRLKFALRGKSLIPRVPYVHKFHFFSSCICFGLLSCHSFCQPAHGFLAKTKLLSPTTAPIFSTEQTGTTATAQERNDGLPHLARFAESISEVCSSLNHG